MCTERSVKIGGESMDVIGILWGVVYSFLGIIQWVCDLIRSLFGL
jgi:hypothetical protein